MTDSWLINTFGEISAWIYEKLPMSPFAYFELEGIEPWLGQVNYWLDIAGGMVIVEAWLGSIFLVMAVKAIMRWIKLIG